MIRLTWLKLGLLACAFGGAYGIAVVSVDFVESRKITRVSSVLEDNDITWAEAQPDGMLIVLSGEAPDEASRFRAITMVSHVTNPAHIRDAMTVTPPEDMPLLAYQVDIMRNADSVVMHGLVPAGPDAPVDFLARVNDLSPTMDVSNVLTQSMSPAPDTWTAAAELGLAALKSLPQVRVEITPATVTVDGVAPADADIAAWTADFEALTPEGIELAVNLRQPRQRLSPFTLHLVNDGDGVQIESCAVENPEDAERVSRALTAAGGLTASDCRIALGAPDAAWPEVAAVAIESLAQLGAGAITVSDTHVTVLPGGNVSPDMLSAQGSALREALPESYQVSLLATKGLTFGDEGPTLRMTRSAEGPVTLDGTIASTQDDTVLASLAAARFGAGNVTRMTSIADDLPGSWGLRSMAAIEALALLSDGEVTVTADAITVTGTTANPDGGAAIDSALRSKLDADQVLAINVSYSPPPEEETAPDPAICVAEINALLLDSKIVFAPGSKEVPAEGLPVIDEIAAILRECPDASIEIGGHTDSQGGEDQNLRLSQARAEAVLDALMSRRALTGNISAKGYGETLPIADNSTEQGREANRRIAFRLTEPDGPVQETLDGSE